MFCLRSWIPILFFLTHASPVYLILFITATYILNRPCVYCSLLLFVLVIALFDFRTSWFEPPLPSSTSSTDSASFLSSQNATANASLSSTSTSPLLEAASLAASLVNVTASAALRAAVEGAKRKVAALSSGGAEAASAAAGSAAAMKTPSWVRREWRVPCFDVLIRL